MGSNINPANNLVQAVRLLRRYVWVVRSSRVWETRAVGSGGPDFLNACIHIETDLDAVSLEMRVLKPIEDRLGRVRTQDKNAPRTIDLDILIFDGETLDPKIWTQAYVALPLAELIPEYTRQDGLITLQATAAKLAEDIPLILCPNVVLSPPAES